MDNIIMPEKLFLDSKANIENNLNIILKRKIGQGIFVSKSVKINDSLSNIILGADCPRIIDDSKTNERIVKFLRFDSVGLIELKKEDKGFEITLPFVDEIENKINLKLNNLLFSVENAILENAHEKLVEIPLVQISLNPIKEILLTIHQNGFMEIKDFIKNKGLQKATRYIHFLNNLDFIRCENERCIAGNRTIELEHILSSENEQKLYKKLLANVLQHGYGSIHDYLKLTCLTPYIRWTTSYFLPSIQTNKLLFVTEKLLRERFNSYYAIKKSFIKTSNQLNQIINAEILHREDSLIRGNEAIFNSLVSNASHLRLFS